MTVQKPALIHMFRIDWHLAKWGKGKVAPAPEYVVVHFTGSDDGTAIGTYKDWLTRKKSERGNSHYLVDASGIYECVDPKKYSCQFACASKRSESHIRM